MSNLTNTDEEDEWSGLQYSIMFICQGVFIGATNLLIAFVIRRYPALSSRKEYIVLAAQTFADGCNQLAYLCAGVYYIIVIATNNHAIRRKPWQCLLVPHNLLWVWTDPLANLMLVIVSFDRFLAINYPLEYIGWPATYAKALIGSAYAYTFFVAGIGVTITLSTMDTQNATFSTITCINCHQVFADAGYAGYSTYYQNTSTVFAPASIVIYIFVLIQYKRKLNSVTPTLTVDQARELKIQLKLMITIGISCFCTVIFNIIPYQIGYISSLINSKFIAMAWITANFNPLCNVIIYPLRQSVVRMGIKAWFTGKIMPEDIRMWYLNESAQPNPKPNHKPSYHLPRQPLRAREAIPQGSILQVQPVSKVGN